MNWQWCEKKDWSQNITRQEKSEYFKNQVVILSKVLFYYFFLQFSRMKSSRNKKQMF